MRVRAIILLAPLASCASPSVQPPSLAPRAAEAIDPRLPVADAQQSTAVDPALATRLQTLIDQAQIADFGISARCRGGAANGSSGRSRAKRKLGRGAASAVRAHCRARASYSRACRHRRSCIPADRAAWRDCCCRHARHPGGGGAGQRDRPAAIGARQPATGAARLRFSGLRLHGAERRSRRRHVRYASGMRELRSAGKSAR